MADTKKQQAEQLKVEGNKALAESKYEEALRLYTEALTLDNNAVLYSNRSAAHTKAGNYVEAIEDAEKAIQMRPDWIKGWSRKGTALCYLKRYEEAKIAFEEGLKIEPDNQQLKDGLAEAESNLTGPGGSSAIGNPFTQPDVMQKLEANPKTREYLKDPLFRQQIELMRLSGSMQNVNDSRMIACLGVLLGIDLQTFDDPDDIPKPSSSSKFTSEPPSSTSKPQSSSDSNSSQQNKSNESSVSDEQKKAKAAKEKGNAAYKEKKFEEAIKHYDEAIDLDPTEMTYLNNKAAVYFEQKKYDECIAICEKAVEVGRENRADFTIIAKALARTGKAYLKKEDEENAIRYLNKSLSEHRAPDIAKLVLEIEKQKKEKERLAYINPEIALEEKTKGNEFYQQGKYPEALKHYTEAIKRNPQDAKIYSNRAACYTKLMEFNLALRDCDECIKLEPNFIKGYLRKAAIFTAMKETSKATLAYQKALELDPNCAEAQQGYRSSLIQENSDPEAVRKRAMENPEIQEILSDPAMRLILEQMQKDPNALKEHLKNPDVASKIEKLLEAGIIAIR
ncbi:stress-induced-phosphoprotein 1-like [Mercenaria mercenaria]|uniref:stress-induced-phosphoprotein 1-like n=1 Tax=Mercenaria mercenaria TaxID=6596 RepID=UPI00234F7FAC|nr:stress-induced-phosphoprotein 1-like [Mercenaria mercenaria]